MKCVKRGFVVGAWRVHLDVTKSVPRKVHRFLELEGSIGAFRVGG